MVLHFDKSVPVLVLLLRPSLKEVLRWAESLEALLTNQCKTVSFTRCLVSFTGNHGYHCNHFGGFCHLDKYTDASFTHGGSSCSSLVFYFPNRLQEAETMINAGFYGLNSFHLSSDWPDGVTVFRHFLRSEFSEENLDFWLAVERFKQTRSICKMAARAKKIYDEFVSTSAARQVLLCVSVLPVIGLNTLVM